MCEQAYPSRPAGANTRLIRWCDLVQYKPPRGGAYFVGFVGGLRIVILRNGNRCEPKWSLCISVYPRPRELNDPTFDPDAWL